MSSRAMAALGLVAVLACGGRPSAAPEPGIEELRRQVANVRASVEARLATETILQGSGVGEADVAVRLATPVLLEFLSRVAGHYLDDVVLDLRPEAVVREGDDVRVSVGPVRIRAGRWDLALTIRRIQARLRAGSPEVSVLDDGSEAGLRFMLPVEVVGGSGDADVDFRWDAAGAAGAVCRDFEVRESFAATVAPRSYRLAGRFLLRLAADGVVIVPEADERLLVQPRPTEESWARVRELLRRQDRIFRCGLALDPDGMEARLRGLLERGFGFRLPDSVLRPVRLPTQVAETVSVSGRSLRVAASTSGLSLGRGWLWYGVDIGLVAED